MYSVDYDERLGIIRVMVGGFFSVEDVERHASIADAALAQCRAEHGDVKSLVLCGTEVQSVETMLAAQKQRVRHAGQYNRMAFVFTSCLAKMQVARFFTSEHEKTFVSESAAILWLLADRGRARVSVSNITE